MGSTLFISRLTFRINKTFQAWSKAGFRPSVVYVLASDHLLQATTQAFFVSPRHFGWSLTGGLILFVRQSTKALHKLFLQQFNIGLSRVLI